MTDFRRPELAYHVEMTAEKLQEMIKYIENAKKEGQPGQVLTIPVSHNFNFIIRDIVKYNTPKSVHRETEEVDLVEPSKLKTLLH